MAKVLSTPDKLEYQFIQAARNFCNFKVQAPNDAHIALTPGPEEGEPMYEVFIGGWSNTKSVIRKNKTKPEVAEAETPNILSENEFREFWIKWEDNTISVGKKGENAFLTHADPELFNISYVGFCTGWGAEGSWVIEEPVDELYWERQTDGAFPENAVSGGEDKESGNMIFVARAEHEGALLPGKFVPSHGVTYVPWGGAEHAKDEYEILCGREPQWVLARDGEVPPNAFKAGQTEDGETLYIGRVLDTNKLMIGKVQVSHKACYVPYGGQELAYEEYEVLVL